MIASDGPKIGTSMNTLRSGTAARATSRPIRAVARGRPMVTTEPKVNNSTKTAAARPSASRAPPSAVATNCTAWPPTSTWSVSLFAHSAAASPPRCLWGRSRVRRARGGRHQLHGHLGADRCAPSDARLLLRPEGRHPCVRPAVPRRRHRSARGRRARIRRRPHPPTACRARSTARSPRRKPRRGQLLVAKLGRTGRLSDIASAVDAAIHEPVRDLPAAGAADGSLRPVNVERTASAIFGAVALVGLHEILFRDALDPVEVLDDVEGLLLRGLAP